MNKRTLIATIIIALMAVGYWGCKKENPFSKDYDINLPAATISKVSKLNPYVGDTIVIEGANLTTAQTVAVGPYTLVVIEKKDNYIKAIIPRNIEPGMISITNTYKRSYNSDLVINPQFYPAIVQVWPAQIERGKTFVLKGTNLDLIKEVKVNGVVVPLSGTSSYSKATYSTSAVILGETAVIEVTPKAGDKQTSPIISVIAPKNTYIPKKTIMVWDFETLPTTWQGWGGSPFTAELVPGFFGKAYRVTSPAGNGWNGCYIQVASNNNGQGFDLSAYNKPYITFLVNTNGKKGYFNPAISIGGSASDKHFTGQGGQYSDNYMISTKGWEWRSYDLEKMGWSNIKSKLDWIALWVRGGNVGDTEPFEIAIDQVMITDGPLNPTLIWDADTKVGGSVPYVPNGGTNLTGYSQGAAYATYKYTVANSWDWVGDIATKTDLALDPTTYANGIYVNFLVNTGNAEGYAQLLYTQGDNKLCDQVLGVKYYGDNYKFKPTNGKWQWRSLKLDLPALSLWAGSVDNFDLSKAFAFSVIVRSGNVASGPFELNVDYFVFTTVPLDPNLVEE